MRRFASVVAFAALAAASVGAQVALARARPASAAAAPAEGALAAFGGFRSIAAEIVWFRADRLQDEGRYVELAQLAHALTLSEPHTPEVWSYAAWNLAYNVSVMMPTPEDRWRWVESALGLLRDSGLRINPRSAELHAELALLFELKMGIDIDDAAGFYRARWREIVVGVASRGAWAEELKMDPARMEAMERRYGVTDRGDPLYSALYWALRGLDFARNRRDAAKLNEVIRQSLTVYRRRRAERPGPRAS